VTIVTVQSPARPRGLTVNSYTSISLDPPLIMISINQRAKSHDLLLDSPFAVNILSAEQQDLALHFAGRHQQGLEIDWSRGEFAPFLNGALAVLECSPWRRYEGGDHSLFIGEVRRFEYRHGDGLGYFRSKFTHLVEPVTVSPGTHDPFELPYDAYE
jgi:flavin reductase (DIM6/NTAB) family NADH-FMN oxidoreductase RutF